MNPADFDEFPLLLGGGAYECLQVRTGPPLDYVARKLRCSLEALHTAAGAIGCSVPGTLSNSAEEASLSGAQDEAQLSARAAFQYALVAYLALNNLLGLAQEGDLAQHLLGRSPRQFRQWLDRLEREASVTG